MSTDQKLRIALVGAGLAGLATARVLRQYHDVVVFERTGPEAATGGQGICFFPSTVKILRSLGYDEDRGFPCYVSHFRHFDRVGNPTQTIDLDYNRKYGVDVWSQLRVDGHEELYRLAIGPKAEVGIRDGEGSVKMAYNSAVVDVDVDSAVVYLENGTEFQADVVIVADGIHSRLRKKVVGPDPKWKAEKMGLTIFRVAIPKENAIKVLGSDLPSWMVPGHEGKGCITYFQSRDSSNRLIVTYPLHRFGWIHVSLHLPTEMVRRSTDTGSWHADADPTEIIEAFKDFDPKLIKLVKAGTQHKVWDMQDLDPLPFWNNGRTILIGDAAHAMTPMQGQGANMAMEDAEAFRLLTEDTTRDAVPGILATIDSVRRPRVSRVLWTTRYTRPNTTMEERMERMDFINDYNGIVDALKHKEFYSELARGNEEWTARWELEQGRLLPGMKA